MRKKGEPKLSPGLRSNQKILSEDPFSYQPASLNATVVRTDLHHLAMLNALMRFHPDKFRSFEL